MLPDLRGRIALLDPWKRRSQQRPCQLKWELEMERNTLASPFLLPSILLAVLPND